MRVCPHCRTFNGTDEQVCVFCGNDSIKKPLQFRLAQFISEKSLPNIYDADKEKKGVFRNQRFTIGVVGKGIRLSLVAIFIFITVLVFQQASLSWDNRLDFSRWKFRLTAEAGIDNIIVKKDILQTNTDIIVQKTIEELSKNQATEMAGDVLTKNMSRWEDNWENYRLI